MHVARPLTASHGPCVASGGNKENPAARYPDPVAAPKEPEKAIRQQLGDSARQVEATIQKYRGVVELRRRQLAGGVAIGIERVRDEVVADTIRGYAADLERYSSELLPQVTGFRNGHRDSATPLLAAELRREHQAG
jgi:hypothetical protein